MPTHQRPQGLAERVTFALDVFGLRPFGQRLRELRLALGGDPTTPPSRFGLSSLSILDPALALPLWLGRRPYGRKVPIYNLFNRTPTPEADGWSVRKTQVEDFRGGALTYDSHNGTDFATPPGTLVVAPAAGRVAVVASEFNRGGLKILLDHGEGLMSMAGHLARPLVHEGETVRRGAPIALSGASGLNFVAALGTDPPHVHFNTWLDGRPVDPFARPGEASLWRTGDNTPTAASAAPDADADEAAEAVTAGDFDAEAITATLAACRSSEMRARLERETAGLDLALRACRVIFFANYYPTRFPVRPNPYRTTHPRGPRLDLPFSTADYDGLVFPDELGRVG